VVCSCLSRGNEAAADVCKLYAWMNDICHEDAQELATVIGVADIWPGLRCLGSW
jgi:hypothetical protein